MHIIGLKRGGNTKTGFCKNIRKDGEFGRCRRVDRGLCGIWSVGESVNSGEEGVLTRVDQLWCVGQDGHGAIDRT